ncbi:hypothetical protein K7472_17485 [Streptomyces sp. PTM05]|uniref:Uncharacterized protein n=1 Tax=Streptantibioticus parmotrematis TaxID=2873249 RepID=A0ABS7QTX2_9ACTN|nr:hypothetical protein [Streptantibioticus parmotrematis]MBY8886644.1 hypothetical protein [Streptantibioticus parmotrematis]
MTTDFIALTPRMPDPRTMAAAFVSHLARELDGRVWPPGREVPTAAARTPGTVPPPAPEPVAAR